jgi:hypothetical protein
VSSYTFYLCSGLNSNLGILDFKGDAGTGGDSFWLLSGNKFNFGNPNVYTNYSASSFSILFTP